MRRSLLLSLALCTWSPFQRAISPLSTFRYEIAKLGQACINDERGFRGLFSQMFLFSLFFAFLLFFQPAIKPTHYRKLSVTGIFPRLFPPSLEKSWRIKGSQNERVQLFRVQNGAGKAKKIFPLFAIRFTTSYIRLNPALRPLKNT